MTRLQNALMGLFVGFSAAAFAGPQYPQQQENKKEMEQTARFRKLDVDKDSQLSESEFLLGRRSGQTEEEAKDAFKKADKDKNGTLNLDEFKSI